MTPFTDDNRDAMRSYLQRVEVRLSTMHRVASAFLGGAGLLILFPVFFREVFTGLLRSFLSPPPGTLYFVASVLVAAAFLVSLGIPLYALYLLLRDLVHFYFVGHSPGFPKLLFSPRFVLSGITFSPDESADVKRAVLLLEYGTDLSKFILPFDEAQATYYDSVIAITDEQIIPKDRHIDKLLSAGVLTLTNDPTTLQVQTMPPQERSRVEINRFNAAMGLAGALDRQLAEEVAKGEASLVRHAVGLRRLVLRYIKALLMFILTTLASFALLGVVATGKVEPLLALGVGYLCWAIVTPVVVKLPMAWIRESADQNALNVARWDKQLVLFERNVVKACWVTAGLVSIALLLMLIAKGGRGA